MRPDLAVRRGDDGKKPGVDGSQSGTQTVHVIHEVECVYHGQDPQDGDGVTEGDARHKERDPNFCGGDNQRGKKLAGEFSQRAQLVFVIQAAQDRDNDGTQNDCAEFEGAAIQAVV